MAAASRARQRSLLRDELESDGVHAVALAGRLGTVVEDVAEMSITLLAQDLGATHEKTVVGVCSNAPL